MNSLNGGLRSKKGEIRLSKLMLIYNQTVEASKECQHPSIVVLFCCMQQHIISLFPEETIRDVLKVPL